MSYRISSESWGTRDFDNASQLADVLGELPVGVYYVSWYRHQGDWRVVQRCTFTMHVDNVCTAMRRDQLEYLLGQHLIGWIDAAFTDWDAAGVDTALYHKLANLIKGDKHDDFHGLIWNLAELESVGVQRWTSSQLAVAVAAHRSTPCPCCGQLVSWLVDFAHRVGMDRNYLARCVNA